MTKDTITAKVEEFRKLVYEPEHEETTCWCKPDFIKREDDNLEIKHHEQRDVLADFLRESLTSQKQKQIEEFVSMLESWRGEYLKSDLGEELLDDMITKLRA